MAANDGVGRRFERFVGRYVPADLPEPEGLPAYVAPLPTWLEDLGLRLAWPIAVVNLLGTIFGFWYYGVHPYPATDPLITGQLGYTDPVVWVFVPDSPVATLFIGLSLIAWKLDWDVDWLHALAFFGCIKLGLWTPYVQLIVQGQGATPLWMYQFLIWSHLAMAVEAFLIHRYADFRVRSVAVAVAWYLANDVVDYFVPIVGKPHHTALDPEWTATGIDHSVAAHDLAAGFAVVLTVLATFLALATRVEKLRR